jgi:DNA-binding protein H-NS
VNPQPKKAGPYVSKYLELKAQIEQMQAQLEAVRVAELDVEITDMKKRIVAFGIRPEQLFAREDLPAIVRPARVRKPPKYAHGGRTWSGEGSRPKWFTDALKMGVTAERMLVNKPS